MDDYNFLCFVGGGIIIFFSSWANTFIKMQFKLGLYKFLKSGFLFKIIFSTFEKNQENNTYLKHI